MNSPINGMNICSCAKTISIFDVLHFQLHLSNYEVFYPFKA